MNPNQLKINWPYAIGEIIIVIIGIRIAFSLNRWAQNAQSQQTKMRQGGHSFLDDPIMPNMIQNI